MKYVDETYDSFNVQIIPKVLHNFIDKKKKTSIKNGKG